MAQTAMFSKFHFTRIFQRATGVSPGRFLSALRLQEAKRLLLTTSMTVADISHLVGYNSIGTFSSRFHSSVGVSPTAYRHHGGLLPPPPAARTADAKNPATVRGRLSHSPGCRTDQVILGLFSDRIAQGVPVSRATLRGAGAFELADVPEGTWHLLAHASVCSMDNPAHRQLYVAAWGPIEVTSGMQLGDIDLWLRPKRIFDPPMLLAHLDTALRTTLPDDSPENGISAPARPAA
ncbi:helix-turn-helix transcriptional regulator [Saccharomonospora marina]